MIGITPQHIVWLDLININQDIKINKCTNTKNNSLQLCFRFAVYDIQPSAVLPTSILGCFHQRIASVPVAAMACASKSSSTKQSSNGTLSTKRHNTTVSF